MTRLLVRDGLHGISRDRTSMNALLSYLANNKRYWLPPILLFLTLLVYLAWKSSKTPVDPFEYRFD